MKYIRHIPNILTLIRFLVLPFFIIFAFLTTKESYIVMLVLYIYSAITDFLDGIIARSYNVITAFGRVFDPISDKALVIIVLLIIIVRDSYLSHLILIPTCIIIIRELVISGIREELSSKKVVIHVSKLGKYKTTSQMFSLAFLLTGKKILPSLNLDMIGVAFIWVAAILTLLSGVDYIIKHRTYLDMNK